jgi:hypothetical protein
MFGCVAFVTIPEGRSAIWCKNGEVLAAADNAASAPQEVISIPRTGFSKKS